MEKEPKNLNTKEAIASNNMLADSLPAKSDAIEFFNWVHKEYWKGMNGWIPYGWNAYASGYTIEKLYDKFLSR